MDKLTFELLNELCPDFAPYNFLKHDMYKGKIKTAHNVYYKSGEGDSEGIILGKRDTKRFELDQFPKNFVTYTRFDQSDAEYGWTGEMMIAVLEHIKGMLEAGN